MRIENRELRINTYFCNRLVPIPFQGVGLIGNQVRILNRPAAVNPQKRDILYQNATAPTGGKADRPG